MKRLRATAFGWLALGLAALTSGRAATFDLTTASIADMQAAMQSGALTAEKLVQLYLARIEAYDAGGPKIGAVWALNPKALEIARALDAERRSKGPRSPLHGIPVIAKDLLDVQDIPSTRPPFKGIVAAKDATVIARLREAGAVILAKVSNHRDSTRNPFDLTRVAGWSSSGTGAGIAAHLAAVGLGGETGFSIRTPSSDSNLFGLSPTFGLVSRDGHFLSYVSGERGGPMAHTMYDLCVTLDVIAGFDSADLFTAQSLGKLPLQPYVSFIDPHGLRGARVGVLKEGWDERFKPVEPAVIELARNTIKIFHEHGAKVFDPVSLGIDLPQFLAANGSPSAHERLAGAHWFLQRQGPDFPFKTAEEILAARVTNNRPTVEATVDLDRDPEYRAMIEGKAALRAAVIALMDRYQLDALIYPHKLHTPMKIGERVGPGQFNGYVPNQMSPTAGLPALIVPMGFTAEGLPVGLEILGRPWSEPTLIKIASGFEAVTKHRRVPPTTPPLPGEKIEYTEPPGKDS